MSLGVLFHSLRAEQWKLFYSAQSYVLKKVAFWRSRGCSPKDYLEKQADRKFPHAFSHVLIIITMITRAVLIDSESIIRIVMFVLIQSEKETEKAIHLTAYFCNFQIFGSFFIFG